VKETGAFKRLALTIIRANVLLMKELVADGPMIHGVLEQALAQNGAQKLEAGVIIQILNQKLAGSTQTPLDVRQ